MKFYIISLVLNVMLVFVPIHHAITQTEEKTETISVSLDGESFISDDGGSPGGGYSGSGGSPSKSQDNSETESTTLENVNNKKTPAKTQQNSVVSKNNEKTSSTLVSKSSEGAAKGSGNQTNLGSGSGSGSGEGGGTGNGYGEGAGSGRGSGYGQGLGNGKGLGSGKTTNKDTNYACQQGKGYKLSSNLTLEIPAAAERLGNISPVSVSISFNSNGAVTVNGASGGNKILQSAARAAAQNIKVTILDPQISRCKVSVTYRFK